MATNYQRGLFKEYEALVKLNEALSEENKILRYEHRLRLNELKRAQRLEEELKLKEAEVEALKKEVGRLNAILNLDGTNSGIPTSRTPARKKKIIPNSRKKSDKKIGGQFGHPKKKLEHFAEEEITDFEEHTLDRCPSCNGGLEGTQKEIVKDELDYEVVVKKTRHVFRVYKCCDCGKESHQPIGKQLKEDNQYGPRVQALSLALMNQGNVSVNKVKKMIYGLSERNINLSEGYIAKLQKRASEALAPFVTQLGQKMLEFPLLHWDDTVIGINTKRGCLRYYGTEKTALYKAHLKKDKAGLDEDRVLKLLPETTTVMHDHNRVNYNKEYSFSNIECNVHLLRDLQKVCDNLKHGWASELRNLLTETNRRREEELARGCVCFPEDYTDGFFERFNNIMIKAAEENKADYNKYYGKEERTLIVRILDYKDNYLAWVVDFSLPFSNNLSERSLRGVKSKLKISGQFQSVETASHYANIKTYIETCHRNGLNEFDALVRLCRGRPYTPEEALSKKGE